MHPPSVANFKIPLQIFEPRPGALVLLETMHPLIFFIISNSPEMIGYEFKHQLSDILAKCKGQLMQSLYHNAQATLMAYVGQPMPEIVRVTSKVDWKEKDPRATPEIHYVPVLQELLGRLVSDPNAPMRRPLTVAEGLKVWKDQEAGKGVIPNLYVALAVWLLVTYGKPGVQDDMMILDSRFGQQGFEHEDLMGAFNRWIAMLATAGVYGPDATGVSHPLLPTVMDLFNLFFSTAHKDTLQAIMDFSTSGTSSLHDNPGDQVVNLANAIKRVMQKSAAQVRQKRPALLIFAAVTHKPKAAPTPVIKAVHPSPSAVAIPAALTPAQILTDPLVYSALMPHANTVPTRVPPLMAQGSASKSQSQTGSADSWCWHKGVHPRCNLHQRLLNMAAQGQGDQVACSVRDLLAKQGINYSEVPNQVKSALRLPRSLPDLLARCSAPAPSSITTAMSGSFNPGAHPRALHAQLSQSASSKPSSGNKPPSGNRNQAPRFHSAGQAAQPSSSASAGRPSSDRACFNCGSPDHWVQDCPKPRRPSGTANATVSAVMSADTSSFVPEDRTNLHAVPPPEALYDYSGNPDADLDPLAPSSLLVCASTRPAAVAAPVSFEQEPDSVPDMTHSPLDLPLPLAPAAAPSTSVPAEVDVNDQGELSIKLAMKALPHSFASKLPASVSLPAATSSPAPPSVTPDSHPSLRDPRLGHLFITADPRGFKDNLCQYLPEGLPFFRNENAAQGLSLKCGDDFELLPPVMLDSGSDTDVITESKAAELGLQVRPCRVRLTSASELEAKVMGVTDHTLITWGLGTPQACTTGHRFLVMADEVFSTITHILLGVPSLKAMGFWLLPDYKEILVNTKGGRLSIPWEYKKRPAGFSSISVLAMSSSDAEEPMEVDAPSPARTDASEPAPAPDTASAPAPAPAPATASAPAPATSDEDMEHDSRDRHTRARRPPATGLPVNHHITVSSSPMHPRLYPLLHLQARSPEYQRTVEENAWRIFSAYSPENLADAVTTPLRHRMPPEEVELHLEQMSAADFNLSLRHLAPWHRYPGHNIYHPVPYIPHFVGDPGDLQLIMPASRVGQAVECPDCALPASAALAMAATLLHYGLFDKMVINLECWEGPRSDDDDLRQQGGPLPWAVQPIQRTFGMWDVTRWHLQQLVEGQLQPYIVYGCCQRFPKDVEERDCWDHRHIYYSSSLSKPWEHPAGKQHFWHRGAPVQPLALPEGMGVVGATTSTFQNCADPDGVVKPCSTSALYVSGALLLYLQDRTLAPADLMADEDPRTPLQDDGPPYLSCSAFLSSFPASRTWFDLPGVQWAQLVGLEKEDILLGNGQDLCFFCRGVVTTHQHGKCCPLMYYLAAGGRTDQHGPLDRLPAPQHPPLHVLQQFAFSMVEHLGPHHLYLLLQTVPPRHPVYTTLRLMELSLELDRDHCKPTAWRQLLRKVQAAQPVPCPWHCVPPNSNIAWPRPPGCFHDEPAQGWDYRVYGLKARHHRLHQCWFVRALHAAAVTGDTVVPNLEYGPFWDLDPDQVGYGLSGAALDAAVESTADPRLLTLIWWLRNHPRTSSLYRYPANPCDPLAQYRRPLPALISGPPQHPSAPSSSSSLESPSKRSRGDTAAGGYEQQPPLSTADSQLPPTDPQPASEAAGPSRPASQPQQEASAAGPSVQSDAAAAGPSRLTEPSQRTANPRPPARQDQPLEATSRAASGPTL